MIKRQFKHLIPIAEFLYYECWQWRSTLVLMDFARPWYLTAAFLVVKEISIDLGEANSGMAATGEMQRTEIWQLPLVCRKYHQGSCPDELIQGK